ncbi:hypothetical protein [Pseudooctadecabacter sp.]|uniref:hypothetical protein n=1 Tax=Pseudooctadecabacter sp. TaxID=1966338 RepID=UPI0025DA1CA8|nr:hypothetical protein [Pseudooctadecabacter sp.]
MQPADLPLIPLLDGTHAVVQADEVAGTSARLFLTLTRATPAQTPSPLGAADVIAVITINTTDVPWPIAGYDAIPRLTAPLSDAQTTPQDPAIAEALANALHGLYPWDGFPDPAFFDAFLTGPRPDTIRLTSQMP